VLSESTLLLLFDFVGDDELTGVGKPVIHWVRDDIVQKSASRRSAPNLCTPQPSSYDISAKPVS